MRDRRVGIWFIGAWGGVAATAALGLAALARRLTDMTGMVTASPLFDGIDLDGAVNFVVGGHDIRRSSYVDAVRDLHQRSNVFSTALIESCLPELQKWDKNVRGRHNLGRRQDDFEDGRLVGSAARGHAASGHRPHSTRLASFQGEPKSSIRWWW